jgi:hypothetical protein
VGFHPVAVALQNDTQIKHEDKWAATWKKK